MPFDIEQEDELDLDLEFEDVSIPDSNMYIADEDKAVELISKLIQNKRNYTASFQNKIEKEINKLFSLFSEVTIKNEMLFYEQFMDLCSRLSEIHKIQKLQDKVVISFGGRVSAGKSKFINTISGIGDKLPVDQKTTTAIPTYIIKAPKDCIHANSAYGYEVEISSDALNAMAHEFYNVYGIGFSTFVDSIIIESSEYALPTEVALLDTPGYTKYDDQSDSKMVISDREKAYNQLSVSDYLIWLIDIDGGTITEEDIRFIESLRIKTPILIVFTKADLKPDNEIKEILDLAQKTISRTNINCFGITAYSANLKKEYEQDIINKFLSYTVEEGIRNCNITGEFKRVEDDMRDAIEQTIEHYQNMARKLFNYISDSDKIMEIQSLATLWGNANQNSYELKNLLKSFNSIVKRLNTDVSNYVKEGVHND